MDLKNVTTAQWVGIGLVGAAVITEIVLVFTNPFAAIWGGVLFVAGGVAGYLLKKNNIVKTETEQ